MPWSPELFPRVIDLENDNDKSLREFFGVWPLPVKQAKPKKAKKPTAKHVEKLIECYKAIGVARDRLPYTDAMKELVKTFKNKTGFDLDEGEAWELLLARLKKGTGGLKS